MQFCFSNDCFHIALLVILDLTLLFLLQETGLAVSFFVQAWVISMRGSLFSSMFNPLCTVIVAIFSAIVLHEET
jgi:hypothetical protein